jgi:hypothetical protein
VDLDALPPRPPPCSVGCRQPGGQGWPLQGVQAAASKMIPDGDLQADKGLRRAYCKLAFEWPLSLPLPVVSIWFEIKPPASSRRVPLVPQPAPSRPPSCRPPLVFRGSGDPAWSWCSRSVKGIIGGGGGGVGCHGAQRSVDGGRRGCRRARRAANRGCFGVPAGAIRTACCGSGPTGATTTTDVQLQRTSKRKECAPSGDLHQAVRRTAVLRWHSSQLLLA